MAFVIATIKVCFDTLHFPIFPSEDAVVFGCIFISLSLSGVVAIPAHPPPESNWSSFIYLPVFRRHWLVLATISTNHFSSFLLILFGIATQPVQLIVMLLPTPLPCQNINRRIALVIFLEFGVLAVAAIASCTPARKLRIWVVDFT